jgi:hypothetical protein
MTELKLDFDLGHRRAAHFPEILRQIRFFNLQPRTVEYTVSQHGGIHVRITLTERFSAACAVALQGCFGSDAGRERWNLFRVLQLERGVAPASWKRKWNKLYRSMPLLRPSTRGKKLAFPSRGRVV